jgi:hypothetical protein
LTLEKYKLGRDTFFSSCFVSNSLQVTINTLFLYEDGNGNVVEENGGPEPIEYIVDKNESIVETIATRTDYLKNATSGDSSLTCPMLVEDSKDEDICIKEAKPKRDYVRYTVQDEARFFDLKIEKCMSASQSAKCFRKCLNKERKTKA